MKIGDNVTFIPSCERDDPYTHSPYLKHENEKAVTGVIVGVNRAHHWYRVEFELNGFVGHECFKYVPAGKAFMRPRPGKTGITRAGHHNKTHNAELRNGTPQSVCAPAVEMTGSKEEKE